jgi:hypothetical protein
MNIIEIFKRGSTPRYQPPPPNRDQDRYIMITFPTSQIQKHRSFSPVVDPPRRRSRKCTLAISCTNLHS